MSMRCWFKLCRQWLCAMVQCVDSHVHMHMFVIVSVKVCSENNLYLTEQLSFGRLYNNIALLVACPSTPSVVFLTLLAIFVGNATKDNNFLANYLCSLNPGPQT